jgi:hypothetical protein
MRCGATDIAIGHGGYPFGLAFGRQYSSHRRHKDGPLGLGWTHNLGDNGDAPHFVLDLAAGDGYDKAMPRKAGFAGSALKLTIKR